ncbi:MAG TPA: hypothetical protein VK814_10745 [Acidobacteriaceae bacterium]|jgi:hypothetical protein|nr:hypothetical protein [Acidobacteriaceae bacterium]
MGMGAQNLPQGCEQLGLGFQVNGQFCPWQVVVFVRGTGMFLVVFFKKDAQIGYS